jgi:hypothetical protein
MGDDGGVCVVLCWIIAMPTWSIGFWQISPARVAKRVRESA